MDAHVVVATKGRASVLPRLLACLSQQSIAPRSITIVGSCAADIHGLRPPVASPPISLTTLIASSSGSSLQRNLGVEHVLAKQRSDGDGPFFIAFFDDDFRIAKDWLSCARSAFEARPDVVGITGQVLADGVHVGPLSEDDVEAHLTGLKPPKSHWAGGAESRELSALYGCNMAFRDRVVRRCRFDENLPLYAWQEDRDYTSQAQALGKTIYLPACRGVHLGITSGRVSGVRFGYSQIANPLYLWRKGTMSARDGIRFVVRHIISNSARTFYRNHSYDYRGRLRGNLLAIGDLLRGTCHPRRILSLS